MLSKGCTEDRQYVAMVVWHVWNNRNDVLWKDKRLFIPILVKSGLDYLERWTAAQEDARRHVVAVSHPVTWSRPPSSFFKCNADGLACLWIDQKESEWNHFEIQSKVGCKEVHATTRDLIFRKNLALLRNLLQYGLFLISLALSNGWSLN